MATRTLTVRLRAATNDFNRSMLLSGQAVRQLETEMTRLQEKGEQFARVGQAMSYGFTAPMAIIGGAMLNSAGQFEESMRIVKAVTQGSASDMKMLAAEAVKLGADTQYSAQDAATGMDVLARAGLDVQQVYAAIPGVMQLAAAGQLDMAEAAKVGTDILANFGLEAQNMGEVNDYLATAANKSKTDVAELGDAFRYVGPVARGAGMSLQETTAALTVLGDNGLRASMAGTALRGVLTHLMKPSEEGASILRRYGISIHDAEGNMVSFQEVLKQFETAGVSAADVMAIFGQRAGPAMIAMLQAGSGELEHMTQMLDESRGSAQRLADAKMGGFTGAIEQLKGSIESLAIQIGDSGMLGFFTNMLNGAKNLANGLATLPKPILAMGAAFTTVLTAAGPVLWIGGRLASIYAPVADGFKRVYQSIVGLTVGFRVLRAEGESVGAALAGAFNWQWLAIAAGIAAVAGAVYLLKQRGDDLAKSHQSAGDSAVALAKAAGLASREIANLKGEMDDLVVTEDDFRKANENALLTLKGMSQAQGRDAFLVQIGYELVLRGASPKDAMKQIELLAKAAGIEVPASMTLDNIDDFKEQVRAAAEEARAIQAGIKREGGGDLKISQAAQKNLDALAKTAATAWNTQGPAAFAAILGSTEQALGKNSIAYNYLTDQALKFTEVQGLSIGTAHDVVTAVQEMASGASSATASQKEQAQAVLDLAMKMGGLTGANVRAAAAQLSAGKSALDYSGAADKAAKASQGGAEAADQYGDELQNAAEQGGPFEAALQGIAQATQMATMQFDAGAAAAKAYVSAIERSTSIDNVMSAGLKAGDALANVRKGFFGIADASDSSKKGIDATREAVSNLSDALTRSDSKFTTMGMRLEALAAGAQAFRKAWDDSTFLDDQAESALNLGAAFRSFSHIVKRLPENFDIAAAATGKYKKTQTEAISNLAALGKSTRDYLATLIESGSSYSYVQSEASRLRGEYVKTMQQAGLSANAVEKYTEMLGLTPKQVETAIRLSGAEEARFKIQSYLSLLDGRIPADVATKVTAQISKGDLNSAAKILESWAKTNPVKIDTEVGGGTKGKDPLWDLPKDFDAAKAALGGYTEEQRKAIAGLQELGAAATDYISELVGAGKYDEARAMSEQLRVEYTKVLEQLGLNQEQVQKYLDLLGLTQPQVETAIVLSGADEAMFKIQAYSQLLGDEIPPEVSTEVLALIDEGQLEKAAALLEKWRRDQSRSPVLVPMYTTWGYNPRDLPPHGLNPTPTSSSTSTVSPISGKTLTYDQGLKVDLDPAKRVGSAIVYDNVDSSGNVWDWNMTARQWVGRANGGPVEAGVTYKTLERGRSELFTPSVPGTITPLHQLMTPTTQDNPTAGLAQALRSLQNGGSINLGGVTVVAPSVTRAPEAMIQGIGNAVWLHTGKQLQEVL